MVLILDTESRYAALDSFPRPCSWSWTTGSMHARMRMLVALIDDVVAGAFQVEDLHAADYARVRELCDRYADSDVGFVDAAVLAMVERLDEPKLATLDHRHFGVLRPRQVEALRLLPEA